MESGTLTTFSNSSTAKPAARSAMLCLLFLLCTIIVILVSFFGQFSISNQLFVLFLCQLPSVKCGVRCWRLLMFATKVSCDFVVLPCVDTCFGLHGHFLHLCRVRTWSWRKCKRTWSPSRVAGHEVLLETFLSQLRLNRAKFCNVQTFRTALSFGHFFSPPEVQKIGQQLYL